MRFPSTLQLPPSAQLAVAPLRPHVIERFDGERWSGLRDAVARQLHCAVDELGRLHELEAARGGPRTRKARRRTTGSRCDDDALAELVACYEAFICEAIAPHVARHYHGPCESLAFQAMPALRVVTPGGAASGRRHRDADYGHQPAQINWWLPLAPAFGSNTLWIEEEERHAPLEGDFGTAHRFHGHALHHYTKPNGAPLDFRVVPGPLYNDDFPASRAPATGRQAFALGGYYSLCALDAATGAWRVERDEGASALRGNAARRGGGGTRTKDPQM